MKPFVVQPHWELNSTLFPNKSFLSSYHFRFFLLYPCPGWKVFSSTISMIFQFPLTCLHQVLRFFINWFPYPVSSPISLIGLGGFSPVTWSFETHQLSYKARIFSLVSRYLSQSHNKFGLFLPSYTHSYTYMFNEAHV